MEIIQPARSTALILFALGLLWATQTLAETPLERGTYLVRGIAACGNCHTPKGPEGDLPGMIYKDSEGQVIYELRTVEVLTANYCQQQPVRWRLLHCRAIRIPRMTNSSSPKA